MPGCRLDCGDQRRLTGNGSALEVVLHDYALYKSTFTLLYFTLLYFMYMSRVMPAPCLGFGLVWPWAVTSWPQKLIISSNAVLLGMKKNRHFDKYLVLSRKWCKAGLQLLWNVIVGHLCQFPSKSFFFHFQNIVFTILATDAQTDERTVERICKNIILPARLTCWRHKNKEQPLVPGSPGCWLYHSDCL